MGKLPKKKKLGQFRSPGAEQYFLRRKKYGPFHWSCSSSYISWAQLVTSWNTLWQTFWVTASPAWYFWYFFLPKRNQEHGLFAKKVDSVSSPIANMKLHIFITFPHLYQSSSPGDLKDWLVGWWRLKVGQVHCSQYVNFYWKKDSPKSLFKRPFVTLSC